MTDDQPGEAGGQERLALIRAETRFELGLLHDRVNALLAAEAFLTIAYTTAMGSGEHFARVAGEPRRVRHGSLGRSAAQDLERPRRPRCCLRV